MINIVALLATAALALVSMQCAFQANAQVENDNNMMPHVVKAPKDQYRLREYTKVELYPDGDIKRGVGETSVLVCNVLGNPLPTIRWEKNGQDIVDVDETTEDIPVDLSGFGHVMSKLIITSTHLGEDKYTCISTSGVHTDSASITVYTTPAKNADQDVFSLEKHYLPSKPTITYYYDFVIQDSGTVLVLPCRVQSSAKTQVDWYDPRDYHIGNSLKKRVLPSGDLLINGLQENEEGNFTCKVQSAFGNDSMSTWVYPARVRAV